MPAQDMTRRDWFRLRRRQAEPDTHYGDKTSLVGNASSALQAIPQPVNHDGMDLSQLPPMREALLSEEQVMQLFGDIETCASDIRLMQRSPRAQRATATGATTSEQLQTARDSLLSGGIPRVQIRYRWQDSDWIDTLESRTEGFRLVRIVHHCTSAG
jgi:hypothetical protein